MKTEAFPEAIIMLYASKKNENVSYLPLCLQGVSLIYGPYIKVLWNSRFYWVDWIHSGNKKLKHTRIDLLNELFSFSSINRQVKNHFPPTWVACWCSQQVPSSAAPRAWILLVDSTFFARVYVYLKIRCGYKAKFSITCTKYFDFGNGPWMNSGSLNSLFYYFCMTWTINLLKCSLLLF